MQISLAVYLLFLTQLLMLPWGIITYFARTSDKSRIRNLIHTSVFLCFNLLWIAYQTFHGLGQITELVLVVLGFIVAGFSYHFWHLELSIQLNKKRSLFFIAALVFLYIAYSYLQNHSIGKFHLSYIVLCLLSLLITIFFVGSFILKIRSLDYSSYKKNAILFASLVGCVIPIVFLAFDSFTFHFFIVNIGFLAVTLANVRGHIRLVKEESQQRKELLEIIEVQERESEIINAEKEDQNQVIQELSEELEYFRQLVQSKEQLLNMRALEAQEKFNRLTSRELEVAELIIQRLLFKEIAAQLNISVSTATKHAANIYAKFGVSTREEFLEEINSFKQ